MNKIISYIKKVGVTVPDIAALAILLVVSSAAFLIMSICSHEPDYAVITVDGKELARLPLSENTTYSIGNSNVIRISDGSVYMIEADCPDKVCIHTGRINKSGQTIVCLPNRVVISIAGDDDDTILQTR